MKEFIQVTLRSTNSRILVAVDSIVNVVESSSQYAYIEQGQNRNGKAVGISVEESYDEVLRKLDRAAMLTKAE